MKYTVKVHPPFLKVQYAGFLQYNIQQPLGPNVIYFVKLITY